MANKLTREVPERDYLNFDRIGRLLEIINTEVLALNGTPRSATQRRAQPINIKYFFLYYRNRMNWRRFPYWAIAQNCACRKLRSSLKC